MGCPRSANRGEWGLGGRPEGRCVREREVEGRRVVGLFGVGASRSVGRGRKWNGISTLKGQNGPESCTYSTMSRPSW